jgi:hypothetical protein
MCNLERYETVGDWSETTPALARWLSLVTSEHRWTMEPVILQEYAAQADRLVAERRRQVVRQSEIVTDLECAGQDAQEARKLLRQYEACLLLQIADRDRLHEHLGL